MTLPITALDVPLSQVEQDVKALVARQQAAALEDLRTHLPLLDPDRHSLDTTADLAFARLACECDDPCACPPGGAL